MTHGKGSISKEAPRKHRPKISQRTQARKLRRAETLATINSTKPRYRKPHPNAPIE